MASLATINRAGAGHRGQMNEERRYLLPPPGEEQPDMRCMRVWVPDHPRYREALLGSLKYLSTWRAWESDPAHRARLAASVWRGAYARTMREVVDECQCEPHVLYPVLPEWADTWEQAHSDTTTRYLYILVTETIDRYVTQGADAATEWLERTVYEACGARISASLFVGAVAEASVAEREEAKDPNNWKKIRDAGICSPTLAGKICAPGTSIYDWLDVHALDIFDALNASAIGLFNVLGSSAATMFTTLNLWSGSTWTRDEGGATYGGPDEFGWSSELDEPCEWVHKWNSVEGDFGVTWVHDEAYAFAPITNGEWTGALWRSTVVVYPSAGHECIIKTQFPAPAQVTYVSVEASYPASTYAALRLYTPPIGWEIDPLDVIRVWNRAYGQIETGIHTYEWTPAVPVEMTELAIKASATNGGQDAGDALLVFEITIRGVGIDPWIQ